MSTVAQNVLTAVKEGKANVVTDLLKVARVEDLSYIGPDNYTALMVACKNGSSDMVGLLLTAGADAQVQKKNGWTALMFASYSGHAQVVKQLVNAGTNVDMQSQDGRTALLMAAEKGHDEIVKVLLAAKADKDAQDKQGKTALMWVTEKGQATTANLLLGAGADVHFGDKTKKTALRWAAEKVRADIVKVLLEAKADVDAQDNDGFTALMVASRAAGVEIVKMLVGAGANIHIQNKDGESALVLAARLGYARVTTALLTAGASMGGECKDGKTALMWAADKRHKDVVEALLDAGADANVQDVEHRTALMWAIEKSPDDTQHWEESARLELVKILIKASDIHAQTTAGESTLLVACRVGKVEIVKLLIAAGADVHARSSIGQSALRLATGHEDVKKVLLAAGAVDEPAGQRQVKQAALPGSPTKATSTAAATLAKEGASTSTEPAVPGLLRALEAGTVKAAPDNRKEVPPVTASEPPKTLPRGTPDNRKEENAKLLAQALQQGSKPWKRSKFSLLGQGRGGKTAFANAVAGRQFEDTASTVGINQLTCDVKHIKASGAGQREQEWGECAKVPREFEAALADILARKQRAAQSSNAGENDGKTSGGDIRDYMEAVSEPPSLTPEQRALQVKETDQILPRRSEQPTSDKPVSIVAKASVAGVVAISPQASRIQAAKPVEPTQSAGRGSTGAERQHAPKAAAETVPVVPVPPELDEEMVMKMLATMQDAESGLLISLFDFGGQSVFEVIHHLFLTRNGVYALVFNMEWLLTDGPDKERALRFMRGWLSSIAVHTFNKTTQMTAPVVFVGTRLDLVTSPAAHEQISTILHEHFSDNLAWRSVIGNEDGKDSNGKAFQWFFPVNNKVGKKGAPMKRLMSVMSDAIETAEYTHKEVPLTWFKIIDQMADTKRDFLQLHDVISTARVCGVTEKEVPLLLSFLHDMGHLMWLDEPGLRDAVILDPVSYLVVPATIIICKLTPDHEDTTHHFMDSHRVCERMHKREWMQLKHDGVLSVKLLPILWEKYQQQSEALQMLMVKFGLLVPLRAGATGAVTQYLVPTLLSPAPSNDLNVTSWTDAAFSSCYFVFTLSDELSQSSTLTEADLKSAGFLPGGMFERLVGKTLSWSQDTAVGHTFDLRSVLLHKDVAVMAFGRQRFRLVHCTDIHCVRVDVEGAHPVGVQQKLQDFILLIIDECMKSLLCFPAVVFQSATEDIVLPQTGLCKTLLANELLIPLQQLRKASKGESMLARKGGRTLLTLPEIKSKYGQWLQLYDLRERYDVFLSYRWGIHDSEFTEQLFDMFTNLSVGAHNRAVEVFLDRKRLQEGRLFKSDFAAALTHSLVVVPVVSVDALGRMVEHDPSQSDNVLLEWIMILESFAVGKILKVFPIVFGKRKPVLIARDGGGSREATVADFFTDEVKDLLPKLPPTATLTQAADLLRANGIEPSQKMRSYTVHSVVNELLGFLLCKASDFAVRQLVGSFADKVVRLLHDCGDAALERIVVLAAEENRPSAGVAAAAEPAPQRQNVPSSSSPLPAASTQPVSTRPLKSLTAEELGRALGGIGLSTLVPIFAEKGVTGKLLSHCEEVAELMSEDFGVTSKVKARTLLEQIEEWNAQGVSGI